MNVRSLRLLLLAPCLFASTTSLAFAQAEQTPSPQEMSDLAPEKVREALATRRAYIAVHPEDPSGYVNLAYALSDAGINDQAKIEILKATKVAPKSAFAYSAQAWVFRHNSIGVDFGRGFDYDSTLAFYRKAIELYPDDLAIRQSLANLLEHNRQGITYAPDSRLEEAIENYRYSKAHSPVLDQENEDNLLIGLFYAGHFQEVLSDLAGLPSSPKRDGILIASITALSGSASGITAAKHMDGDEQRKKDALNFAAEGLWNMRLYPQAADILTASLPDTSYSKSILGKIQIFSNLRPYKGADLPPTDPRSPVQRLMYSAITDSLNEDLINECISHHPFSDGHDWKRSIAQTKRLAGIFRNVSRQTGLPQVVVRDIILGTIKINLLPSQEPGSRIVVEFAGISPRSFFVLKEDGRYKIVAGAESQREVGMEALYLLHHDQEAEAASLFNWERGNVHKGDGDDALGGSLFARLWTPRQSKGRESIELAAASLLAQEATVQTMRPQVVAARNNAKTDHERDDLTHLLVLIDLRGEDSTNAGKTSQELLKRQPDSLTAVALAGRAYGLRKDWPAWKAMLAARLQTQPNEPGLLLEEAVEAEAEGDFSRARHSLRIVLDGGHASANDYNTYAWLSLFAGPVDEQALSAAQQANLLTQNSDSAYLNTLACVSAAQGKTAQARQLLLEAMTSGQMEEPDGPTWYGFGRIYEQYGVYDAAKAAYSRVEKPEGVLNPVDPFVLAQISLRALAKGHPKGE